jgi:hypothetical protein
VVKFRFIGLALVFLCGLGLAGCSSGGAITITLSPTTPPVINSGETQAITATLTNDTHNEGVTWSLTGPGTLTDQTSTTVTYVAPTGISIEASGTVTATSVANTTITAVLNITVNPVLAISTNSLPVGAVGSQYVGVIGAIGATGTFTWTITSGKLPAGLSLSQSTTSSITILGTPTTVGTSTFTIQVTDSAGASVSKTLGITINPPAPLSVATKSLPEGTVGTAYGPNGGGVQLAASSGHLPYTWALTGGSLPPGNPAFALSSTGLITGTPTTAGTSSPFTVQVTDSSNPPQMASASFAITINPSTAGNSLLNGNYAFLVSGFAGSSNSVAAGSFLADGNGNITSGLMDSNSNGSGGLQTSESFTGTYAIGLNGLGTMTLNVTAGGTSTFAVALQADGSGQIIEFGSTTGSGTLLKQDTSAFSTSSILGGYAFGFLGVDAQSNRYGFAGQFTADGAGNFNSGTLDSDDSMTGASGQQSCSGTYSVQTSPMNGRGTATITVGGQVTSYSFYIVSAAQLLMMEIDSQSGQTKPLVSGSMLQQSGSFGQSSLNGTSVLEASALTGPSAQAQVGLFATGSGNWTLNAEENTGGSTVATNGSGGYTVGTNGRVSLTGSGIAISNPVLYLVSSNEAFIVGTDAAVTFGFLEPQSGAPFAASSLSGNYAGGSLTPIQSSGNDQIDIAVADGVVNTTFTTDMTINGQLSQNQVSSATYTLANTGAGVFTYTSATAYFYMVSATEFYELYTNSSATLEHFQQ